ncbi:AMP-binding protein [Thermanaerovibrio acidaminovorans]|uniref:AMP-binding protein n=1 Tax=Thermanaerovibrio acidaminovorans TaxID=81462 RepID=UPI00249175B5|nr:AMP-binding protein [Thermanaerovibrio acidaminovorans]
MDRLEKFLKGKLEESPGTNCYWWKGQWRTRRDLADLVVHSRRTLEESGFREGMRLGLMMPNCPMVLALSIAAWSLGGAVAPLNLRSGFEGLMRLISMLDLHGVAFMEDRPEIGEGLKQAGIPSSPCGLEGPLRPFTGRGASQLDLPDVAVIFSTSGTTGLPKAVPISHRNIMSNVTAVIDHVEFLRPGEVLLNALPNFHTLGYSVAGMLPLIGEMSQAIIPSFIPPDQALAAINAAAVTGIIAVPTMISMLVGSVARGGERPRGVNFVISGGDKLNVEMDRRCGELLGAPILEGYGLTECSPVVAVNRSYDKRRLGTVGPIVKGYEWQIRDLNDNLLEDGSEGVLWVKGPSVTAGYFRDRENTQARFRDGWFNTGDVVRIDPDGYVTILDRATDIIIVGGFNVYPQEVELCLLEHPAVAAAVAVGERNSMTGEVVKAFVVLKEGASASPRDIIDFAKDKLPHFKVPRKVVILPELPISSTGKVSRRALREMDAQ